LKGNTQAIGMVLLNGWQVNRPVIVCERQFFKEAAGFKKSHAAG